MARIDSGWATADDRNDGKESGGRDADLRSEHFLVQDSGSHYAVPRRSSPATPTTIGTFACARLMGVGRSPCCIIVMIDAGWSASSTHCAFFNRVKVPHGPAFRGNLPVPLPREGRGKWSRIATGQQRGQAPPRPTSLTNRPVRPSRRMCF